MVEEGGTTKETEDRPNRQEENQNQDSVFKTAGTVNGVKQRVKNAISESRCGGVIESRDEGHWAEGWSWEVWKQCKQK